MCVCVCVCVCVCIYIYIYIYIYKRNQYTDLTGPYGFRRLRFLEFPDNQNMRVLSVSALRTGRLYLPHPQDISLVLISVRRRRNDYVNDKNSNDPIEKSKPEPFRLHVYSELLSL